ncbi:hypothetical protein [Photobacterium atrarenae]|uniref:Uncharacterized protein n=1 Tax=Photobacterium atrarenae TaxID=865757 RepID=A0ABY5GN30_9GAMM|nr:hypothetical protein [Photobacterium atrarenae]UTV29713.1 hypothetical protein NNL38_22140 [Photobacterium atrarenae]
MMKTFISCFFACTLVVLPATVQAKWHHHGDHYHKHRHHKHKHHKHKHHKHRHYHRHEHHYHRDVVVVKEKHYHQSRLPEIATFAVIAGVTYAIVNNTFYKKSGNEYRAVERPAYH